MSVHVGHMHPWQIVPAHIGHWLEKHLLAAAAAGLLLVMAGIAIATVARHRPHPIQFLDAIDEITTCKASLIVRTEKDIGLWARLSGEYLCFDRQKGTMLRVSRNGVTERIEVDDGVHRSSYTVGGGVVRSASLHSLDRVKKQLRIEEIRGEKWDVVSSSVAAPSDDPSYYRYLFKSAGHPKNELFLVLSKDNRLTVMHLRQPAASTRPTREDLIAHFDLPIERSWFVADARNPQLAMLTAK